MGKLAKNRSKRASFPCFGWDLAGLVWHVKRPKAGNGEKKWKTAPSWKKWQKMAKKWPKNNGKLPQKSSFWAIFAPVQLGAVFHFDFHFFSPFPAFGRFPCHASPAGSQCFGLLSHGVANFSAIFALPSCVLCQAIRIALSAPNRAI